MAAVEEESRRLDSSGGRTSPAPSNGRPSRPAARFNGRTATANPPRIRAVARWALVALALATENQGAAQSEPDYDKPPLNYSTSQPNDAVSALQARVTAPPWTGGGEAVLRRLLKELRVPIESQVLVFSKTSFQRQAIAPNRPRAIYFSDTCYVGWVPGGLVEVAAIDPQLGPIFYSFDPNADQPRFVRDSQCMNCHGGQFVRGIPGVFVRSVFTAQNGEPLLHYGTEVVDFRTPLTNRWGGWYVTGTQGTTVHRGNTLVHEEGDRLVADLKIGPQATNLSGPFPARSYLRPDSDIVALLVLEHQTAMQNTLTRATLDCRRMLAYQKNLQRDLKEPVTETLAYDSVKHVFDAAVEHVVDDLLFRNEARLPSDLEGSAAFPKAFGADAPRADDGSSLKDLQVAGHLFKNRCSYLIYSECFLTLPAELKRRIQARLADALNSATPDPRYDYIHAAEKARISKILKQTHPNFRHLPES